MIIVINKQVEFKLNRPVAPGESIADARWYLEILPEDLAQETFAPVDYVKAVLQGNRAITPQFAQQLEPILKIPADFGLCYDKQFQKLQQEAAA